MTDSEEPIQVTNPYEELKNEMQSQMDALRQSFDAYKEEKEKEISDLQEANKGLQRALVREAFSPVAAPTEEPTEQEKYKQKVLSMTERSIQLMKQR